MNRSGSVVFRRRERRACEGVRIGEGGHSRRTTMRHLVLVSISSFCLALVASVGLAADSAAHPEAAGVVTRPSPEGRAAYHRIVGLGEPPMRASFLKSDRPRPIDRYIDFFGGAASIVAGLAVAGGAGLVPLSDQGVTRAPAASVPDAAPRRARRTAAAVFTGSTRGAALSP